MKGKLSPRFIGPFEILKRVGEVAYRLAFPPSLEGVHNVFLVSQLRRYIGDPSHALDSSELESQPDLSYVEQPFSIVDRSTKSLKNREISLVLVSWNRQAPGEATGNGRTSSVNVIPICSSHGLVKFLSLISCPVTYFTVLSKFRG